MDNKEKLDFDADAAAETPETAVEVAEAPKDNNQKPAAKENAGVYVHKFKKLYEYEGKKYETLNFYFERLTGKDVIAIENEMMANSEYALDPLLSRNFQSKMASRAGNIGSDALANMPFLEFNKITNAARNFLIDSGY